MMEISGQLLKLLLTNFHAADLMDNKHKLFKRIITILLLVFTAVSIVYGVVKEIRRGADQNSVQVTIHGDILFYFHSNKRCSTCKKFEKAARKAVEEMNKEPWGAQIVFKVLNREKPENSRYVKKFKILGNAVVIAAEKKDKPAAWKNLERIWRLSHKEEDLKEYIKQESRIFLEKE